MISSGGRRSSGGQADWSPSWGGTGSCTWFAIWCSLKSKAYTSAASNLCTMDSVKSSQLHTDSRPKASRQCSPSQTSCAACVPVEGWRRGLFLLVLGVLQTPHHEARRICIFTSLAHGIPPGGAHLPRTGTSQTNRWCGRSLTQSISGSGSMRGGVDGGALPKLKNIAAVLPLLSGLLRRRPSPGRRWKPPPPAPL